MATPQQTMEIINGVANMDIASNIEMNAPTGGPNMPLNQKMYEKKFK